MEMCGNNAAWMRENGPENDIILSSRARLARNLSDIPFPNRASREEKEHLLAMIEEIVSRSEALAGFCYMRMAQIPPLQRQMLVEEHLISPQHAEAGEGAAVVLSPDGRVSIMVGEEDHLRIQVLLPGLQLEEALQEAWRIDDVLEEHLDYAFDEARGYLTTCPTNVGTGLRASVMLHLPGLTTTEQMKRMIGTVSRVGLAVRGLYGEGTEVVGNIYQLSNQVTLGHAEEEIVAHVMDVARQILQGEREVRRHLQSGSRLQLEDTAHRALGVLAHARQMSTHEALERLSALRLGIDLGLVQGLSPQILKDLLVSIRPAHLQYIMQRDMEAPERDVQRAALIRGRLREMDEREHAG